MKWLLLFLVTTVLIQQIIATQNQLYLTWEEKGKMMDEINELRRDHCLPPLYYSSELESDVHDHLKKCEAITDKKGYLFYSATEKKACAFLEFVEKGHPIQLWAKSGLTPQCDMHHAKDVPAKCLPLRKSQKFFIFNFLNFEIYFNCRKKIFFFCSFEPRNVPHRNGSQQVLAEGWT